MKLNRPVPGGRRLAGAAAELWRGCKASVVAQRAGGASIGQGSCAALRDLAEDEEELLAELLRCRAAARAVAEWR
ncbi:hypothetical protein JCGZ_10754 [Jatropha curcas]|uniref:Uncharacterized protein n=1 Tax=Jatropha curcas TaxID=180498 RepID=A0A067LF52_JATCU|nr:hypothetical protein JCGZ_10754 [Jatropha curcas]